MNEIYASDIIEKLHYSNTGNNEFRNAVVRI